MTSAKSTKKAQKKSVVKQKLNPAMKFLFPVAARFKAFMSRRPHRSFQLTKRRDYARTLTIPGYWSFTFNVAKTLRGSWKTFGGLALVYMVAIIVVAGTDTQQIYTGLKGILDSSSGDLFQGAAGDVGRAGLLLLATVTTGLSPDLSKPQSIVAGLALFFVWLATIWLLRNLLAGHKPRIRDALYNSGAPVLASVAVGFIILLQLIPAAIASIVYSAAETSGLLESGVSAMLAWMSVALLVVLSIYWVTGSVIALVITTLPGMYPVRALRAAGDLVVGRRVRILLRLIWMVAFIAVLWALIIIPFILFDNWLKHVSSTLDWLPLVPIVSIAMSSISLVFATSYIYLLYRRIVDDESSKKSS